MINELGGTGLQQIFICVTSPEVNEMFAFDLQQGS